MVASTLMSMFAACEMRLMKVSCHPHRFCRLPSAGFRGLLFFVCWWLCGTLAPADEVVTVSAEGKESVRSGTIRDLRGAELTLLIDGRETTIPMSRVKQVDADWLPRHTKADKEYAAGEFEAALAGYREAFQQEKRAWVKRRLLSRVVLCYRNLGRYGEACRVFAILIQEDPDSTYFHTIPLQWQAKTCPADVRGVVEGWLAADSAPSLRMLAASWLLVDRPQLAIGIVRELARDDSGEISHLAVVQLLRSELLSLQESRLTFWVERVGDMPRSIRPGGYYLLGQAHARFRRIDDAVLAFLRVPILYAEQVDLAQRSLNEAAGLLVTNRPSEAMQLYRDCIRLGAQTEAGLQASGQLAEMSR